MKDTQTATRAAKHNDPNGSDQKRLEVVAITPPPANQRVRRQAQFAQTGEKRNRYHLPLALESGSPIGYRTRLPLSEKEAEQALALLSLERPTSFVSGPVDGRGPSEGELFEEASLGVLSARQSTNFNGFRQVTFDAQDSARIAHLLRSLQHRDAAVLDDAAYTHVVLSRPYRTPFTFLLTFLGHHPLTSLLGVAKRAFRKRFHHEDDIPTVSYLQQLHIGILADAMTRAAVIASTGKRRAQVHSAPFCSRARQLDNRPVLHALEEMCGITAKERHEGWRVALVGQVGHATNKERVSLSPTLARKLGANLLAFRSERIQPGVNAEPQAPEAYQQRQDMDVPEALTVMAGRAAFNAFHHWSGVGREQAKALLMLERIDVLTDNGKERLRHVREQLENIAARIAKSIPAWADVPTGRALSKNTLRGKKAFALAGQRIYIGGLSKHEVARAGLDWDLAVRAIGAASARSALYVELMGTVNLPDDCDLLAGICLMAGPVNQNDVGKQFFGERDLLSHLYGQRDPTSLLVWTLKAKTIADPIGNEEQLLNPKRKGALVDLRPAPHQVVSIAKRGVLVPMRLREGRQNEERAFYDCDNFVRDGRGQDILGNTGAAWPQAWRDESVW